MRINRQFPAMRRTNNVYSCSKILVDDGRRLDA